MHDITDQFLNEIYDSFSNENVKLLQELKSTKEIESKREREIHRQIQLVNSLLVSLLKLRNLRKTIEQNRLK